MSAASGVERSGAAPAERSAAERNGAERSGAVRRGTERSGASGASERVIFFPPMRHFGTLTAHRAEFPQFSAKVCKRTFTVHILS